VRFIKIFLLIVITLLIVLTITYSARVSVINNVIKAQPSLIQIEVTCLDFSLSRNMNIIVDKFCLQSPKADIEIVDMAIQWQYSSGIKITDINVKLADIKGTDHLFSNTNHDPQANDQQSGSIQNFNQLLSTTLQPYIEKIKQLQLPININIAKVSYLPFIVANKSDASKNTTLQHDETPYTANLSAIANTFSFSLYNAEKVEFIKAKLSKNKKHFSIELSSKLNLLKSFASKHQLPITAELQDTLNTINISGEVDSLIEYQTDFISMKNQITDIAIDVEKGINKSGTFKVFGELNFNSRLNLMVKKPALNAKNDITDKNNSDIELTFLENNKLSLNYSQAQLFTILEDNEVSPALITILRDNPPAYLSIKPQSNATLNFNNEKISLSNIEITAHGDEQTHQVKLDNIAYVLPTKKSPHTLTIENFIIDSQLNLTSLTTYTNEPVTIHLEGSLRKTEKQTDLNLAENSLITVNNIVLHKQQGNVDKSTEATISTTKNTKNLLSLKALTVKLNGNVQLIEDNGLSINLKVHNQASQVNILKKLQIHSFDLDSQINGSFDDIRINTIVQADGIGLGSIAITGPISSPKIEVAANKLQLTDLLSLNMQLPTKIELIDGVLSYSVKGQLTDLSNIENTPFDVSVAVTSASGSVDGIWLEELTWQQHFTILAGEITTKPNTKENLTVALIETPTPISKLSISTNWTFNKSFTFSANKLKAEVLGGSFSIPKLQWPFEHGHSVNVQLNSIDLEQVLALDKKQGIVVTGNISGQLPVTFDGDKFIIEDGKLHNISNGLIQVIDNPAVAELKANNTQLKLAFDALQNLHYHQLSSAVSMADDGYMQLNTVIKGRNPDIDNDVNLNLNLSYDLLGLLESLSITQRFEKSIIKGLQKNKE
jgi:hypothetical protein